VAVVEMVVVALVELALSYFIGQRGTKNEIRMD